MTIEAGSKEQAKKIAEEASTKLLANAVMEQFTIEII
jgi:phosphoribosylformylglycinamidine (FGAM) synthase PurS component